MRLSRYLHIIQQNSYYPCNGINGGSVYQFIKYNLKHPNGWTSVQHSVRYDIGNICQQRAQYFTTRISTVGFTAAMHLPESQTLNIACKPELLTVVYPWGKQAFNMHKVNPVHCVLADRVYTGA